MGKKTLRTAWRGSKAAAWLSRRSPTRVTELLLQRRVRLYVEELEDRSTPSASSLGLDALDFPWLTNLQTTSMRSDVCEVRDVNATLPTILNTPAPGAANRVCPAAPPHEVILVDAAVPNLDQFLAQLEQGLPPGRWYDLYVIDSTHGGVEQISEILSHYHHDLDAVHLFSHGSSGELLIGSDLLDADRLSALSSEVAGWGNALKAYGDLLLYGCDVAAGARGEAFVEQLHVLTGLDVAASTNDTGASLLGGDWTLETHLGEIGTASLSLSNRADAWSTTAATTTSPGWSTSWVGLLNTGTAVWNDSGDTTPNVSAWNGSSFGAASNSANVGSWRNIAGARSATRDETILAGVDSSGQITGEMWNGTSWSALPFTMGTSSNSAYFAVAIAYESQSGDAILVWDNGTTGTNGLSYRVWNGTSWSAEQTITAPVGTEPLQLQLVSNPIADGMVLVVDPQSGGVDYAVVWDGSSWGNGVVLDNGTGGGGGQKTEISAAYESLTGHAVVAYDADGPGNTIQYQVWDGTSWSGQQTITPPAGVPSGSDVTFSVMAADPNSNRIALGVVAKNEVWYAIWDGSAWGNKVTATTASATNASLEAAAAFESQSGQLLVAYGEASSTLRYRTWTAGGGWSAQQNGPVLSANPNTIVLNADPFSDAVMLSAQDNANDLHTVNWNGSAWGSDNVLSTNTGEASYRPFGFLWDLNRPPVITSNGGGASGSANTPENSAAVLTVSATDPDGNPLTYSLVGGADASLFAIDPTTGLLSFLVAPDFENPTDVGANNVYDVIVQVDDGHGATDTQALAITVTNVNEAPVLSLPGGQVTAVNAALVFSVTNANQLSIADDSGAASIRMTLSVASGRLTLGSIAGLAFTVGDGVGDATMTFTGSQSAINAAIATLTYVPNNNFAGIDNLQVTVNDLGQTGSGGAQQTTGSVEIEAVQEIQVSHLPKSVTTIVSAVDSQGNFVMAFVAKDSDKHGIFARRFDSSGNPLGAEFQVNTTSTDEQLDPSIGMDDNGNFVVVWKSVNQDGSGNGVYGQRFNASGAKVGGEFRVNTTTAGNQDTPSVAMDGNGDFVVVWRSDGTASDVFAQRYNAAGVAQGTEFRVNTTVANDQDQPAIAIDDAGEFVVTWRSNLQDGSGAGVYARMFDAAGNALSGEIQVNTTTAGDQDKPTIARDGSGAFVIAWASGNNQDGSGYGIYARRFDASGAAQGNEFQVNTTTVNDQDRPSVGIDDSGAFTVAWDSNNQDGDKLGVYARRFQADGTPTTGEFRVSGTTQKDQKGPTVSMDGIGDLVIGWGGTGLGGDGVFAQVYRSVNDPPVANVPGAQSLFKNTSLTFLVGGGNGVTLSDPDAGSAPVQLTISVSHGTLTFATIAGLSFTQGDGTADATIVVTGRLSALNAALNGMTYTPIAGYAGGDVLQVGVNDLGNTGTGGAKSDSATVNLTISDRAPVAGADSYGTSEDTPLTIAAAGVLSNDSDPDGDGITAVLVTGPTNGSLTLNANGSFTYTPNANFNGTDSFTYRASDGSLQSNVATVTLTVNAVNDAPVAVADAYSLNEDTTLVVNATGVLANDSDVDGPSLSAVLVTGPTHGSLTLSADGSLTYTPNANYNGADSFTYQASDGSLLSNVVTVSLTVNAVNDAPVAVADSYSTNEDTPLTVAAAAGVLSNDSDVDSPSLTAVLVAGPTRGSLTLNADGSFTYTPNANYNGPDSFTYRASDGSLLSNAVTVSLTINAVNDAPVAVADAYSLNEDTTLAVNAAGVLANDSDVDGPSLSAVLVTGPTHGSLTLNADGSFTYTPNANYNGPDSFTYQASDGSLLSNVVTVSLTINAVNDAPVAVADAYATNEDTPLTVSAAAGVLANDFDVDSPSLTAILVAGPTHGSLTLNPDGSFTYTPDANYNGPDSFTYQASDGSLLSNVVTVSLTINAVNDAPVAVADAYVTNEDVPLTVNAATGVLANDFDVDSPALTAILVSGPTHGSLTLNADGSFTYTPDANYNGADSFTYQASDGSLLSNVVTVSLTINPVNDAPVAAADAYVLNEDVPLTVAASGVLANDSDIDSPALTAVLVSGPTHGSLTFNADGSFTYTPDANYNGADSFAYQASDGSLLSNVVTVSLTINPVNDAPVAAGDAYALNEDTPLAVGVSLGVLANDSDVDSPSLSAVLVSGPRHGSLVLNSDGSFVYLANANYNGSDSFTYEATDGGLYSNEVTVSLSVAAVNDAPTLVDFQQSSLGFSTRQMTPMAINAGAILGLTTDVDGDPLTTELVAGPSHGTLVRLENGSYGYVPAGDYLGADQFLVRVSDGRLHSDTITVHVLVEASLVAPPPNSPQDVFLGTNGLPTNTDQAVSNSTNGGSRRGLTGSSFGVGGEEEAEQVRAQMAANPTRLDFAGADKSLPLTQLVVVRADASRPPIDGRWSYLPSIVAPTQVARFQSELWQQQSVQLYQELDRLSDHVNEDVAMRRQQVLVAGGVTVTLTSGYVLWQLRSFYLLLSALSARPLWRTFDPLMILDSWESKDDDEVEKMFD